jgi:hypothetical protein
VSSLTTGALVLSSMEGITQQGRGKTRRVPPGHVQLTRSPCPHIVHVHSRYCGRICIR